MAALFTFTTFLAALLLFFVQPLVTRLMLPSLGGSPSVWNTAMVFFQAALLAGYGYAHYSGKTLVHKPKIALAVHGVLLLLPLAFLPLALPAGTAPPATAHPILWLLGLLTAVVGVPFFVISTTSPLLQRAFALTPHPAAKDPYFLYAASNAGSLLALLSYPILVEPNWPLSFQTKIWTAGYALLIPCLWLCLFLAAKSPSKVTADQAVASPPILWPRRLRWILLAFAPSSLMLSVTTYLSTDVVAIPLMWILPLSLYLLSFMVVFSGRRWIAPELRARLMAGLLVILTVVLAGHISDPLWLLVTTHLVIFFAAALLCHGELALDRPSPDRLTEFYGWMAFGGVLGGAFNALLAPLLFKSVAEYSLTLILTCALLPPALFGAKSLSYKEALLPIGAGLMTLALIMTVHNDAVVHWLRHYRISWTNVWSYVIFGLPAILALRFAGRPLTFGFAIAAILLAANADHVTGAAKVVDAQRSFFGIHRVMYLPKINRMELVHGATSHGMQYIGDRSPISYYSPRGPAGDIVAIARATHGRLRPLQPFRVAVVGLGSGVMAGYIRPREDWTFYEIDPAVASIARDPRYFTYWSGAPSLPNLELGDARLRLKSAPDHGYDLIILDAYSSDTIPVHLVTREALALYRSKLASGGLIGWHLSNRHFDLEPVVGQLARDCRWSSLLRHDGHLPKAVRDRGISSSRWACLAASPPELGGLNTDPQWRPLRLNAPLWTDDFSSLWTVLWRPDSLTRVSHQDTPRR